jgi:hypothetical protein
VNDLLFSELVTTGSERIVAAAACERDEHGKPVAWVKLQIPSAAAGEPNS